MTRIEGHGSWIPNPEVDQMMEECVWRMGDEMDDPDNTKVYLWCIVKGG